MQYVSVACSRLKFQGHFLRPRLYKEKLSRVEGSPAYPSYPGLANFSYISLQNLANRLHEKQKVCDGRVTLLAGPTFLHINTGSVSRDNFTEIEVRVLSLKRTL